MLGRLKVWVLDVFCFGACLEQVRGRRKMLSVLLNA